MKFHVTDEMYVSLADLIMNTVYSFPMDVLVELAAGDVDVFLCLSADVYIDEEECPDVVSASIRDMRVKDYAFSAYPKGDDTNELENDFDVSKVVKELIGRKI